MHFYSFCGVCLYSNLNFVEALSGKNSFELTYGGLNEVLNRSLISPYFLVKADSYAKVKCSLLGYDSENLSVSWSCVDFISVQP